MAAPVMPTPGGLALRAFLSTIGLGHRWATAVTLTVSLAIMAMVIGYAISRVAEDWRSVVMLAVALMISSYPMSAALEFRRYLRVCRASPAMAEKRPYDLYRAIASAPEDVRGDFARLLRFLNWYDFERHEPFPGFMPQPSERMESPHVPYGFAAPPKHDQPHSDHYGDKL